MTYRFNIKTDRLLRSLATDKLSCDIHPRKNIKMVRRMSRDHIIIIHNNKLVKKKFCTQQCFDKYIKYAFTYGLLFGTVGERNHSCTFTPIVNEIK